MSILLGARLCATILSVVLAAAGVGGLGVVYAQDRDLIRSVTESGVNIQAISKRLDAIEAAHLPEHVARLEADVGLLMAAGGAIGTAVIGMGIQMIFSIAGARRRREE